MSKQPSPKADQVRALREARAERVQNLHRSKPQPVEKVYKRAVNVLKRSAAKKAKGRKK